MGCRCGPVAYIRGLTTFYLLGRWLLGLLIGFVWYAGYDVAARLFSIFFFFLVCLGGGGCSEGRSVMTSARASMWAVTDKAMIMYFLFLWFRIAIVIRQETGLRSPETFLDFARADPHDTPAGDHKIPPGVQPCHHERKIVKSSTYHTHRVWGRLALCAFVTLNVTLIRVEWFYRACD